MQCNFVIKGLVSLFVVLFGSLVGTVDWIDNILVEKIKILISVAQLTVLLCGSDTEPKPANSLSRRTQIKKLEPHADSMPVVYHITIHLFKILATKL